MTVRVDQPQLGAYKMRMVKHGVFVPVLIYIPCPIEMRPDLWNPLDRSRRIHAMRDLEDVDVFDVWPSCSRDRIDLQEYAFMAADRAWVKRYGRHLAEADPRRSQQMRTAAPVF